MLIFLQLRSVLGRRTGNEKPPFDPYTPRDVAKGPVTDDNKVVTLPKRSEAEDETALPRRMLWHPSILP